MRHSDMTTTLSQRSTRPRDRKHDTQLVGGAPRRRSTHRIAAYFSADTNAVIIDRFEIREREVIREAQRWTNGDRGPIVDDPAALAAGDLTSFVAEAIRIGARMLALAGQAQDAWVLEKMLKDVGDKTAASAEMACRAGKEAAEAVSAAADAATKAITTAEARSRKQFASVVSSATNDVNHEIRKLFAGDHPELLDWLDPALAKALDKFQTRAIKTSTAFTSELFAQAAKHFDPSDPASPMAKSTAQLARRQDQLTKQVTRDLDGFRDTVEKLVTATKVREATALQADHTPIKGVAYEDQIATLLADIAANVGDEYIVTRNTRGALPRCLKGDGVLIIDSDAARLLVEMTDSEKKRGWGPYLDVAERNRKAVASLGLVRHRAQNHDRMIQVIGTRTRRIVMAFNPDDDDPELLATAVLLLRAAALAAATRTGQHEIATAEEKITEAIAELTRIDDIKALAAKIHRNATEIDAKCRSSYTSIRRVLGEALNALGSVASPITITDSLPDAPRTNRRTTERRAEPDADRSRRH